MVEAIPQMKNAEYYRTKHRAVYPGGYINQTITLSLEAKKQMEDNGIINQSLFINDLIRVALHKRSWEVSQFVSEANALQARAKDFGFVLSFEKPQKELPFEPPKDLAPNVGMEAGRPLDPRKIKV